MINKSKIMQGNKHACVYQDIICASFLINCARIMFCTTHCCGMRGVWASTDEPNQLNDMKTICQLNHDKKENK